MAFFIAAAPTQAAEYETDETLKFKKDKGFLTRFFNKAVEIGTRAAVTNVIKIAAVSAVAGAGLSSVATLAVASAASGVGAALYSYGRDTFTEWRQARATGAKINWRDPAKLKRAKIALLTGVAGGAFGAWLAGTEFFHAGIEYAKEFAGKAFSLMVPAAAAAELPVGAAMATAKEILHAPAAQPNVLARLWDMSMKSDQATGKFAAYMLKADPDSLQSVSPQFLKDRAHDVLRLKDIPWQDRLTMAHDLAEAAKERGNKQAVQFLKDLTKLGYHAPVEIVQIMEPAIAAPAAIVMPAIVTPEIALPEINATGIIPPASATVFNEVATCTVAGDAEGLYGIDCVTHTATMQPGDYVSFVDKSQPLVKISTPLLPGSVEMPTASFMHENVMSDGVSRLNTLRQAIAKPTLGI